MKIIDRTSVILQFDPNDNGGSIDGVEYAAGTVVRVKKGYHKLIVHNHDNLLKSCVQNNAQGEALIEKEITQETEYNIYFDRDCYTNRN